MPTIRVGTASPCTQPTTPATLALLSQIASRASRQHIDLLLLPEAFIGGYPRGSTFGCAVGSRTDQGREEFVRYFEQAVDLGDIVGDGGAGAGMRWVKREIHHSSSGHDHQQQQQQQDEDSGSVVKHRGDGTREELERIARDTGVFLVTGLIEKTGGSLYCAVVYVCPRLGMVGKRRKIQPTGSERLIWAQGGPATLAAVTTTIRGHRVNLAAAICWENYMPLVRQALYAQNVNLYLAPTADARDSWMALMRTVGIEGRCFVVSSNMCVRESHQPCHTIPEGSALPQKGSSPPRSREVSPAMPPPPPPRRRRRKSVFDEDGNEIVLCCDAESGIRQDEEEEDLVNGGTHTAVRIRTAPVKDYKDPSASFLSRGGSSIVSPFGDVLAGPLWEDDEGIIFADIDLRQCIAGRLDLDTAGSYSRNDSFRFSVVGLDLDPLPY